jgi:hypothetical protein
MKGSGMKNVWFRIRDEKMVGSGFGIQHPGSGTLIQTQLLEGKNGEKL